MTVIHVFRQLAEVIAAGCGGDELNATLRGAVIGQGRIVVDVEIHLVETKGEGQQVVAGKPNQDFLLA